MYMHYTITIRMSCVNLDDFGPWKTRDGHPMANRGA